MAIAVATWTLSRNRATDDPDGAPVPVNANVVYVAHMMGVVPMLVLEVPFSKWSHMAYRPLGMYFSTLREKALIIDAAEMSRMIVRVAHEIVEGNRGTDHLAIVGLRALTTAVESDENTRDKRRFSTGGSSE